MRTSHIAYLFEDREPLAVFLASAVESGAGYLTVYSRVGEHGLAEIDYLRKLPLADEPQYRALHAYLSSRYTRGPGEQVTLVIDQAGAPR